LRGRYKRYGQGKLGPSIHLADIASNVALRPHPELRTIIDKLLSDMKQKTKTARVGMNKTNKNNDKTVVNNNDNTTTKYMTLHARVEPDMQVHWACKEYKVVNLTDVVTFVERYFDNSTPDKTRPSFIFISLAREILEVEVKTNRENVIARDNLVELERVLQHGMFNGTVPVYHGYSNILQGTRYSTKPSTTQAMISYYIALQSDVFVGTRVSSYSQALVAARFYRNNMQNYEYVPITNGGIQHWTPVGKLKRPPSFDC
jgi:GDP-fucose protein O-fucosyltransferase